MALTDTCSLKLYLPPIPALKAVSLSSAFKPKTSVSSSYLPIPREPITSKLVSLTGMLPIASR